MTKISNQYSLTNVLFADAVNGRVGIGTASPTVPLDVVGAGKFSGSLTTAGAIFTTNSPIFDTAGTITKHSVVGLVIRGTTASVFDFSLYSAGGTALITNPTGTNNINFNSGQVWFNGGNVGIGTTNPATASGSFTSLDIRGNTGSSIVMGSTASLMGYVYVNTSGLALETTGTIPIIFNPAGTERMRITSAGNVGIGTSSPTSISAGYTTVDIRGTSGGGLNFGTTNAIGFIYADIGALDLGTYGSQIVRIYQSSNLRMTVSANGSIGAPSGTNIYNASDARLKRNIETIDSGLNKVMALNPVKFNWIENYEPSEEGKDMLGFIAQEVLLAVPEAVENFASSKVMVDGQEIDDVLRVNEKFIIPVLVKAIQEQQTQINELKALLNAN